MPGLSGSSPLDIHAVNPRAIKDFDSRFIGASNEKWYSTPGGYMSYFRIDGFGDRAFYDKKGYWQSSLKLYGENRLPKDVRALVRSNYFDFSIALVEEVQIPTDRIYFVHLKNGDNEKLLRVTTDGDMQTLQDIPGIN